MNLCNLQETCTHYTNGTKRKGHHIRISDICKSFIKGKCDYGYDIQQGPACSLKAIKEKKEKLK